MLHYKIARRYNVKLATRFTSAVWLELGLAQTCLIQLQAACSFVILTSQISFCNVHFHMFISKLYSFMPSTAQRVLFCIEYFQVSGKHIHDHHIEVLAALF